MERRWCRAVAAVAVTVSLAACSVVAPPPVLTTVPTGSATCALPGPGVDFAGAPATALGLDAARVRAAAEYAGATGAMSYRVYRHGCLVVDGGLERGSSDRRMPAFSMTKSVVSLLVGRAVRLGRLGVDDPVGPYLRRAGLVVDEIKAALTVRQFLTQTTGVRMPFLQDLSDAQNTDSVAAYLARPFEAVPGTRFIYAQTAVSTLVAVVEGAVGRDIQEFARDQLFGPIGIEGRDWRWDRDPAGHTNGFAGLDMTPRAFARLGILAGAGGRWNARRLIDADYLEQAQRSAAPNNPCYGFLIRSNRSTRCGNDGIPASQVFDRRHLPPAPVDTFAFNGAFDQETTVIPSLDMVVVRMGAPSFATRDPLGPAGGLFDYAATYRSSRLLMRAVTDKPQPEVPDWSPDPDPPTVDLARLLPLPLPVPWPTG